MKHKPYAAGALGALLLITTAACGGSSDSASASSEVSPDCTPKFSYDTVDEGTLTVAIPQSPPYYSASGSEAEGIDDDILTRFAADSCKTLAFDVLPSASVIESVRTGRADVAGGGWYSTEERGEIVNLSDPTYVDLPTIISETANDDVESLAGKNVGTVQGYTWVDQLQSVIGSGLKQYQSSDAVISDIEAGRLDAAVLGGIDGSYLLERSGSDWVATTMAPNPAVTSSVTPSLPNYPATKGNDELTDAINTELDTLRTEGFIADTLTSFGIDPVAADVDKYATS